MITLAAADLQAQLADIRASLAPFYRVPGSASYYPVRVRPTLGFSMVPRRKAERAGPGSHRDASARRREQMAWALAPALAGAGLVDGFESDASPFDGRNPAGACGLTRHGAKLVEDFCRVWRDRKHLFAVWTVTLPPDLAAALDGTEQGFARFQSVLRRRFSESLARACRRERGRLPVEPDWCFVCEPQKSGRPHLHFVFRSRSRMGRPWLLSTGALDRLIKNAAQVVTGLSVDCAAAGNVQSIQKDMGRYLSSYLKKGVGETAAITVLLSGWTWNLIPGQWWGLSASARRVVACHTIELPGCLVHWLSLMWPQMSGSGLLKACIWQAPGPGAPAVVVGNWSNPGQFRDSMVYLFGLMRDAIGSAVTFGVT